MFASALDKIETLGGRGFLLVAYVPVLVFVVICIITYAAFSAHTRDESVWSIVVGLMPTEATPQGVLALAFFLLSAPLAYVLLILSSLWRRLIEGAVSVPGVSYMLRRWFVRDYLHLRKSYEDGARDLVQATRSHNEWLAKLVEAMRAESEDGEEARKRAERNGTSEWYRRQRLAAFEERVQARVQSDVDITHEVLSDLSRNLHYLIRGGGMPIAKLDELVVAVDRLWRDKLTSTNNSVARAQDRFQTKYSQVGGPYIVLPSALGNAITALWDYPSSRYQMDPSFSWPRLRAVMSDAQRLASEQARLKYDFCSVMTLFATLYIFGLLGAATAFDIWSAGWLWIAFAGALIFDVLLFFAAAEAVRGFAETVRVAVDLHRFDLLKALRISPPRSPDREKELWLALSKASLYGEPLNLRLKHPE